MLPSASMHRPVKMIKPLVCFSLALFCAVLVKAQYTKDILIEQLYKADSNSIGQKIHYPAHGNEEVTILKVTIPPGKSTGWHKHLFPVFAYVSEGTLTVEIENRGTINLPKNASFPEVVDTYHNGTNRGDRDVVLIVFYMGEKGKPLSVKKEIATQ